MPLVELDANIALPRTPQRRSGADDLVKDLTDQIVSISILEEDQSFASGVARPARRAKRAPILASPTPASLSLTPSPLKSKRTPRPRSRPSLSAPIEVLAEAECLRTLTWEDVCPLGDRIEKIAEASYAEVYRVTNDRGMSIIKVIRLESPIKPQTKAQQRSGLVDEEPHTEDDLDGELKISELVADIPGFVVYKEKYIVEGKTTPALLETHQTYQRRMKRKDPDRLQFYPSPSRYLEDTQFLVVELGDAGTALEDFDIESTAQVWDMLLGVAVALARAENLIRFEHRDLHEGNVCFRQVRRPKPKTDDSPCEFGYSGLDVTILDYGLSRADDITLPSGAPIASDLERDLSLFTSTHAAQCHVYRQMRSYLINGDRIWLDPKAHNKPYQRSRHVGRPISWLRHHSYTNVLWLAYLYEYLVSHFRGSKRELARFTRETREFWTHLNPESPLEIMSFASAEDIVEFAAEAGWITEEQLAGTADGEGSSYVEEECSIIGLMAGRRDVDGHHRRSPRVKGKSPVG
ncbi:hypothetical protein BD289DRAFT_379300 [Coniella lustricola]|uniref:non-specific serine/threonine protein kinase n=1 Tax=Coniella lustricola TaxID=2025994 RepID=A0A2T2ZSV1_9PEZI|nr:hypothetical protein BD289DRAFT_379300 [Coniella lustricola]